MCKDFLSAISNLNFRVRESIYRISDEIKNQTQEILIKINKPIIIFTNDKSFFLLENGELSSETSEHFTVTQEDIFETIKILNKIYPNFREQAKNGFITLKNGHKIGLGGTSVIDNGEIINISEISSINLRISREFIGCSNVIFDKIGNDIGNTIIFGAPLSGKTTILRDIARKLSITIIDERLRRVAIIDEKKEIASVHNGIPQKDIGFCDVLSGFKKNEGMIKAIKNLAPQIIICDEICSDEDISIIKKSLNCGIKMIFGMYLKNIEDISKSHKIINILMKRSNEYVK